jgi:hypothetical protein
MLELWTRSIELMDVGGEVRSSKARLLGLQFRADFNISPTSWLSDTPLNITPLERRQITCSAMLKL